MSNEELKHKLLEWAGWHWEKYEVGKGCFAPILLAPDEGLVEGHIGYIPDHTPDLTSSLDVCFKWLVPEAFKRFGALKVFDLLTHWSRRITFYGEEPALVLCELLEKLIEAEGSK